MFPMSTPALGEETQSVFEVVNKELTGNLQSFMDNIPVLTTRYSRLLEATKSLNPKAQRRESNKKLLSPLLQCRKPAPAFAEEDVVDGSTGNNTTSCLFQTSSTPPSAPLAANSKTPPTGPQTPKDKPSLSIKADSAEEILENAAAAALANRQKQMSVDSPQNARMKKLQDLAKIRVQSAKELPPIPEDELLMTNLDLLTYEAYELRIVLSGICDWIEMQMPAIKMEDNRGVMVQESVIRHLVHMRGAVQAINERQRQYVEKVADYTSKYYENPGAAAQWAQVLHLWNNEQWDQLERDWRELRQIVVLACRILSINMDRLHRPRDAPGGVTFAYM